MSMLVGSHGVVALDEARHRDASGQRVMPTMLTGDGRCWRTARPCCVHIPTMLASMLPAPPPAPASTKTPGTQKEKEGGVQVVGACNNLNIWEPYTRDGRQDAKMPSRSEP